MGVKDLWGLVSPLGEVLPLTALQGTAVAIDLAPWVVDSQNVNMGRVTRPHLRNLLWRTLRLLNAGVLPVFVLEGDAPSLKWDTISKRNQQNFANGRKAAATTVKTGKRSQFKTVQKECAHLLDLLGVPWVQAIGEAEATCAALNYHQVVSGVITQDSDVFLYGGETVFRNFTANQSKATVEKFKMSSIEEHLGFNRSGLLVLGLLLGCDYLPAGVPNVGKETAIRMIREWYQKGVSDPLDRIFRWSLEDEDDWKGINPKKWKTGSLLELEAGVRGRALATDGFPFMDIIKEYKSKIRIPIQSCKWRQPQMQELMSWCIIKLDWEPDYALDKIAPVISRWIMMNISPQKPMPTNYTPEMQPVRCVKKCVRGGVSSMVVEWNVVNNEKYKCSIPAYVTTDEPITFIKGAAPHLIEQFEAELVAKKKGKRSIKKKSDATSDNEANSVNLNTIEAKKSLRKKPVGLDPKLKPITNYLKPKSKIEDITNKQIKELESASSNMKNVQNQDCLSSLRNRAVSRSKEKLAKNESQSTGPDVNYMYKSSLKMVKTLSIAESFNEGYDIPSMNDDELAELSGMFRELDMGNKQEIKKDLITKGEQNTIESKSPKNNNFNILIGKEKSGNIYNAFNESCDKNSSEIYIISKSSFSEKDQNIACHVNRKPNKKNTYIDNQSCLTNAKSQIQLKNEYLHNNSNTDAGKDAGQEISTTVKDLKKPLHEKIIDQKNSTLDEKNNTEESITEMSSGSGNETILSSERSNFVEESWEEDDDNDFELSMIINRITGMKMVSNENSIMSKNTDAAKSLNTLKNKGERGYVSDENSLLSLKSKFKPEIKKDMPTEINPKALKIIEESENNFKKSTCWDYFTPISERQDIPKIKSLDIILDSQTNNESNFVGYKDKNIFRNIHPCNKIDINTSKEIANNSEKQLITSLKIQKSNMVTAQTMATDIIRSSLKDSSALSTFGNTMSDSILAEVADRISFSKKERLESQASFDLFENSNDSNINKETDKDASNLKSEDINQRITPNLPKHHSTPLVGCIAPRRILNCERLKYSSNYLQSIQGNNLLLPSPFTVSSPAQTSFLSDCGSPFTTHDPSSSNPICKVDMPLYTEKLKSNAVNGTVSKVLLCKNKEIDTPVSSKVISHQVCHFKTSESLSSNEDHHEVSSEYQCKNKNTKYKLKEENQLCFKLLDSFDNSDHKQTSPSKIPNDNPSDIQQIINNSPKVTITDTDSMNTHLSKGCSKNKYSQLIPEGNNSIRNIKEKRKPFKELMDSKCKVDIFQNDVVNIKGETSKETNNYDLQNKKSIKKVVMKLKNSHETSQDKDLHNENDKENIESTIEKEKDKKLNLCSKYSDMSTFSPVVPSQYIPLADRLKAKYRNKAMENLIDQM